MNTRTQITLDSDTQRRAQAKAAEQGVSFAEYIRRLLARDLGQSSKRKERVSVVFDLVREGPETDIARNKGDMIGEAVWNEHVRKTRRPKPRSRSGRR
jgi:hypothetical protein